MVFVRFPFENNVKCVFQEDLVVNSSKIQTFIRSYLGSDDFRIYCNGKELFQDQEIFHDATIHVTFSLPGGKGGFGSMLRAIGAQIEKTTNREACRDLSGRRLRDINEEQRLKKWIAKETEREEEKLRRRKERIERLKAKPRHHFVDFQYEKVISELPERIDDALTAGMQKVPKRPVEEGESSKTASHTKKQCLWLEDISDSSGSDSEFCGKPSALKDRDCSSTNIQNENISQSLGSETSGGESSNCSTSCGQSPNTGLDPVALEQTSPGGQETSASGDDSACANENQAASLPLQGDKSCNVNTNEASTQETQNQEDDSPIDLLSFDSPTELEVLGLNRLKVASMARGLKCGGNVSDRALRLWKVRGLQPQEYPTNLLAKTKK